jgi:hypothetical protein
MISWGNMAPDETRQGRPCLDSKHIRHVSGPNESMMFRSLFISRGEIVRPRKSKEVDPKLGTSFPRCSVLLCMQIRGGRRRSLDRLVPFAHRPTAVDDVNPPLSLHHIAVISHKYADQQRRPLCRLLRGYPALRLTTRGVHGFEGCGDFNVTNEKLPSQAGCCKIMSIHAARSDQILCSPNAIASRPLDTTSDWGACVTRLPLSFRS